MTSSRQDPRYGRVAVGTALATVLALAGCSNYSTEPTQSASSPSALAAMKGNPNTEAVNLSEAGSAAKSAGSNFTGRLAQEYFTVATARADSKDWVDADFFARKSIASSKGDLVLPEENKVRSIPMQANLNTRGEMDQARARLMAALDGGGRDKYPVLAARTQSRYDCWLERTEANYRAEFNGQCRQEFVANLNDLEVLLHPPGPYQVSFDFNSATLKSEALQTLQRAAAALPKEGTSRLKVVAKTDTKGSDSYNQKLSDARAEAVRTALASDGVAASRIDVTGVGEREPEVATKNGVKEPRNRVADVTAMVPEASYK